MMTQANLFPSGDFARNVANAIVTLLCEKLDEMKNANPEEISKFKILFAQEINNEIERQGNGFRFLQMDICEPEMREDNWFTQFLYHSANEGELNIDAYLPSRTRLQFIVHADGEIFWDLTCYGYAKADKRLEDYPGKPQNKANYIELHNIKPKGRQEYAFDLGLYRPMILPCVDPLAGDSRPPCPVSREIEKIEKKLETLKQQNSAKDSSLLSYYERMLSKYQSMVSVWKDYALEGEPDAHMAFVPEYLLKHTTEESFYDIEFLKNLRRHPDIIPIFTSSAGLFSKIDQIKPESLGQLGYEDDGLFVQDDYQIPHHSKFLMKDILQHANFYFCFRPEGESWRLVSVPFYLYQAADTFQTGIGEYNKVVQKGENLALCNSIKNNGEYSYGTQGVSIKILKEEALPYLRYVQPSPIAPQIVEDDEEEQIVRRNPYKVEIGNTPVFAAQPPSSPEHLPQHKL